MIAEYFLNGWITKPLDYNDVENLMIEFAKYHVEKALKQASKKVNRKEGLITDYKLTESILNAYPTNLIV